MSSSKFDIDQELIDVKQELMDLKQQQQIDHNQLNYLIKKEFLLLELKLVNEYNKISPEAIPIIKDNLLSFTSPLRQEHSFLASLINCEDAGKEIKRNNTINYFNNYMKPFSPSSLSLSISLSSSNHSLSQNSDLDLSSHSEFSLTDITSLNDRFEKESLGLRYRKINDSNQNGENSESKEHVGEKSESKEHVFRKDDDNQSLLKSITGITEIDNEFLWNFEI